MKPRQAIQPSTTSLVRPRRSGVRRAAAWVGLVMAGLVVVPVLALPQQVLPSAHATGSCAGATYTVVSGDSWSGIAAKFGITMTSLLSANSSTTATMLHPADVLCLPSGVSGTPTTSTTAPLPVGSVTIRQFPVQGLCWFSDSWGAPRSGGRTHEGVDVIAATGKAVYAADDGVLTRKYIDAVGSLAGNGWRLTRADGTYFFYAHLSTFASGLAVGSAVQAGQIIGYVGQTGAAGTPHLHFEVHPGGGPAVNPTAIVAAVNGCKITTVPPQPGDTPPTTAPTTTVPPTTAPTTTVPPTTTAPPATTTTVPPTTTTVPLPSPAASDERWQFMTPVTALDTRAAGGQPLAAGVSRPVSVGSLLGVAADTKGVMVRVVANNAARSGNLIVHPCGSVPSAASLNFSTTRLNATTTMVKVTNGAFCVTANTSVDVRVDVIARLNTMGVGMAPIASRRALDTRASQPLSGATQVAITPSMLGAPRGTKAVTASFTLLAPVGAGSLSIGPCGGTPWVVPFTADDRQVFGAVSRINDVGLCVSATTAVDLVIDVTGVWQGLAPLGVVAPQRLLDSRSSSAIGTGTRQVALSLPAGATRAQVTVAVLPGASTTGALVVWNCADAKPTGSVVSTSGSVMAVTMSLSVRGAAICLSSSGSLHAVVDLTAVG